MHLNLSFRHSGLLEFLFALFPSIIILFILIPSLHLLYASEDAIVEPEYTIKILGHQWYWSYEFTHIVKNHSNVNVKLTFDITQNIKIESDLNEGEYRLLEVDNTLKFPIGTPIRLLISSADVLHSWSMPAFGIKVDAVPGRLNAINTFIFAPGTFYGQCSELCGVGHGFMPIKIEAVSKAEFLKFIGMNIDIDTDEVTKPTISVSKDVLSAASDFLKKHDKKSLDSKMILRKIIENPKPFWYDRDETIKFIAKSELFDENNKEDKTFNWYKTDIKSCEEFNKFIKNAKLLNNDNKNIENLTNSPKAKKALLKKVGKSTDL